MCCPGTGAAGFNGVTLSWLDTYYDEASFTVYRRPSASRHQSHVADVLVPSSRCGGTVAPLTFTDQQTGYTPGARVVYTVVAVPGDSDQDSDLGDFTGFTEYTVPWLALLKATVLSDRVGTGGFYVTSTCEFSDEMCHKERAHSLRENSRREMSSRPKL